ncbi:MAG: hypothetical protein ACRDRK_05350 [Pseudonocardia sp.]
MRFSSQLFLTGAVVCAVTASTGAALTLTASAPAPQLGSAVANAPVPPPAAAVPEPPADEPQIDAPAGEQATSLVEERRREPSPAPPDAPRDAPRTDESDGPSGSGRGLTESDWQRLPANLRQMTRDACASGLLKSPHCETA